MNTEIFRPTNRCFDDAIDFLQSLVTAQLPEKTLKQYRLAHGILLHPLTKELYAHAWVERNSQGGIVYHGYLHDGALTYGEFGRKQYYEMFGVKERTLYTLRESWRENRKYCNYGPWVEKYIALCLKRGTLRSDGI